MVSLSLPSGRVYKTQTNQKNIMYVLQSIAHTSKAVWLTETLPMPRAQADRVARERLAQSKGRRRYRLVPVDYPA